MIFNVNDYVFVRLTERGREVLRNRAIILSVATGQEPRDKYPPDTDGWSKFQMWELMNIFGEHTFNGAVPCFETWIRLND